MAILLQEKIQSATALVSMKNLFGWAFVWLTWLFYIVDLSIECKGVLSLNSPVLENKPSGDILVDYSWSWVTCGLRRHIFHFKKIKGYLCLPVSFFVILCLIDIDFEQTFIMMIKKQYYRWLNQLPSSIITLRYTWTNPQMTLKNEASSLGSQAFGSGNEQYKTKGK